MALDFCAALHAKECICWIFVVALRAAHRGLCRQFVEQRLGVLQVGGVEALGEPFVNLGERRAGSPLRLVSRSKRASEVVARNSRHFDSWEIATARADL